MPIVSPRRVVTLIATAAVTAATMTAVPLAAPAYAEEVTMDAAEVGEALFVAGDIARVSGDVGAVVLEGVLQDLYAVRPDLSADDAVEQIQILAGSMDAAPATQGSQLRQQSASGDQTAQFCQGWSAPPADREPSKRDEICADWTVSQAARLHFLTEATQQSNLMPETKRAVRKQVKKALEPTAPPRGTYALQPNVDSAAQPPTLEESSNLLVDSYQTAQTNAAFAAARDALWADAEHAQVRASVQARLENPQLADLADLFDENGNVTMSAADAEKLADTALNGDGDKEGVADANKTAVDALTQLTNAQQKLNDAKTEAEKEAAKKEVEKAKERVKEPLGQAKEIIDGAKTIVQFATFVIDKFDPEAAKAIQTVADTVIPVAEGLLAVGTSIVNGVINFYTGNWVGLIGDAFNALSGLEKLFGGSGAPKPDPVMEALKGLKADLEQLGEEMHQRFDAIDSALEQIYGAMITGFTEIITRLEANATQAKQTFDLLEQQRASLVRFEDRMFALLGAASRRDQEVAMRQAFDLTSMDKSLFDSSTSHFATWALNHSGDELSLGANRSFDPKDRYDELNRPLDTNVDYLSQYAANVLGQPRLSGSTLPNPTEWGMGARAFGRVLAEHPGHFSAEPRNATRLDQIIELGSSIRDTMAAVGAHDTTGTEGTGNRLLDAAIEDYSERWDDVMAPIATALAASEETTRLSIDLWQGVDQPIATTHLPALPAIDCGPGFAGNTVPDTDKAYATTMPPAVRLAVAAGAADLKVCSVSVGWIDEDERIVVTRPLTTMIREGRLQLRLIGQVRTAGGVLVASAPLTYTDATRREICRTETTNLTPEPETTTTCGEPRADAAHVAQQDWSTVTGAMTFSWSATADADAVAGGWLHDEQRTALGTVVNRLRAGGDLREPSRRLSAARMALVGYVTMGLPQEITSDGELSALLADGWGTTDHTLDGLLATERLLDQGRTTHVESILLTARDQLREVDVPDLLEATGAERRERVTAVLREHITADDVPGQRLGSTFVETTLDRLELTRSMLGGDGPVTTILSGPPSSTSETRPAFTFSTGEDATMRCRVFAVGSTPPSYGACSGPESHRPETALTNGDWVFEVRGTDDALIAGATTSRQFTVSTDGTTPDPGPGTPPPGPPAGPVLPAPPAKATSFTLAKRPKVKGKKRVGRKLRVTTGRWSPTPTKVRYRWFRGKQRIKGKKGARPVYRVARLDRGKRLRVRVVVKAPGVPKAAVTSTRVRIRR